MSRPPALSKLRTALSSRRTGDQRRRNFRGVTSLLLSVAALVFVLGQLAGAVQKSEKIYRADKVVSGEFELVDPDGKPMSTLWTTELGQTMLSFLDKKRHTLLDVGILGPNQPGLQASGLKR